MEKRDSFKRLRRRDIMRSQHASHWQTPLLLACILLAANASPVLAQSRRTLVASGEAVSVSQPGFPANARWDGQALVGIEQNSSSEPVLYRIDREGRSERIRFSIPDAGHIFLEGVSAGPNNKVAVIGVAYAADGRAATFVARIARDQNERMIQTLIRVWPYCPKVVTVAPDDTIWTAGYVLNEGGYISEGNVLMHFDRAGQILNTTSVQTKSRLAGDAASGSQLRASRDRVMWLTNQNNYIEFSQNGDRLLQIPGPPLTGDHQIENWGLAVGEDGRVAVGAPARSKRFDVWGLDRAKQSWFSIEVPRAKPPGAILLGFDKEDLVVVEGQRTLRRYKEVPQGSVARD
jgi:hypothetical protein